MWPQTTGSCCINVTGCLLEISTYVNITLDQLQGFRQYKLQFLYGPQLYHLPTAGSLVSQSPELPFLQL